MAVERTDVIDAIGTDKESGRVVLSILDQLPFDEEQEHLLLLQEKLNRYLGFIESGEILAAYPNSKGRELSINIIFKNEPTVVAQRFLESAKVTIIGAGIGFLWRVYAGEP